jgi:2-keto-4-pentenoate hydratase/2-oxohepta-3-ene-1,7-dioic acid hydratase in catechol pathway
MKLLSYLLPDGTHSYGTADGGKIRDVGDSLRHRYPDLRAAIAGDALDDVAASGGDEIGMDEVTLLPPVPNPDKVICVGLNYIPHIKEGGREVGTHPSIFTRYPSSLVGHASPLVRPKASHTFDYEGELAVVIGKAGRHIPADKADAHILGYSCFNDGSIREFQRHTTQFWPGKSFEKSGSWGPWIVTPDEVGDITAQRLTTRLDGIVMQEEDIAELAFGIPTIIEYLSTVLTLLPGDVIATGTPGGVGVYRKPPVFLAPGTICEVEITGVGTLVNGVVDED